jgi:hypothetical protein
LLKTVAEDDDDIDDDGCVWRVVVDGWWIDELDEAAGVEAREGVFLGAIVGGGCWRCCDYGGRAVEDR